MFFAKIIKTKKDRILSEIAAGPPPSSKASAPDVKSLEADYVREGPPVAITAPAPSAPTPTAPPTKLPDVVPKSQPEEESGIDENEGKNLYAYIILKFFEKMAKEIHLFPKFSECCICMDARRGIVFLPCGHVCACAECAQGLSACPLCRVEIAQKITIYR